MNIKDSCRVIAIILGLFVVLSFNIAGANQGGVKYQINEYPTCQELGCPPNTTLSFQNYMRNVYQRIENLSLVPVKDAYGKIAVSFQLDRSGNLVNLQLLKSSGDQNSDYLALETIKKSSPFGAFPADSGFQCMAFSFTFFQKPVVVAAENTVPIPGVLGASSNMPVTAISTGQQNISSVPANPFVPAAPCSTSVPVVPGVPSGQSGAKFSNTLDPNLQAYLNRNNNNRNNNNMYPATYNANTVQSSVTRSSPCPASSNPFISDYNNNVSSNNTFNVAYSNLIGSPGKNGTNYNKSPRNPMQYAYQARHGDYIQSTIDCINSNGILVEDYHFQNFPIKYWIQPVAPQQYQIIRDVINDYSRYFPMMETRNKAEADLTIEVGNVLSNDSRSMGKAGFDCSTLKGNVTLSPKIFDKYHLVLAKLTVKHEIAHAFGLIKHSDNPDDIMYPMQRIDSGSNPMQARSLDTGKVKTFEQFGTFSARDLNTLWLLYNQWF